MCRFLIQRTDRCCAENDGPETGGKLSGADACYRGSHKKIDGELEAAYLQLEVLITQLSADTEADHAETLKVLDGMRASLGTSMQQNLDQLNASFLP